MSDQQKAEIDALKRRVAILEDEIGVLHHEIAKLTGKAERQPPKAAPPRPA